MAGRSAVTRAPLRTCPNRVAGEADARRDDQDQPVDAVLDTTQHRPSTTTTGDRAAGRTDPPTSRVMMQSRAGHERPCSHVAVLP